MAGPRRLFLVLTLLVSAFAGRTRPAAAVMTIQGSAQLGTVKTVSVTLGNSEPQPFAAQVYEAMAPSAPRAKAPPAALRVPLPAGPQPISEALAGLLAADPAAEVEMLVYLRDQADLGPASAVAGWAARGQAVYDTLAGHARRTQAPLLEWLGEVAPGAQPQPFWIVNAIALRGDLELARQLAGRAEVAILTTNQTQALAPNESQRPATGDDTAWGLEKINAPAAWADWGARGQGIVVANIDTGVAYSHTALLQSYRGWSAGQIDHNYNWFDATSQPTRRPADIAGHGTHTMGTMVGRAAGALPAVGVAPGARWIAARGCPGFFCSQTDLIEAAEWMLAPRDLDGLNPRPDLRPHIVNNSWGGEEPTDWFDGYATAWNAAGMISVFSNGNGGRNGCGSVVTPARSALVFSVGATNSADQAWESSSRGPAPDGRSKPEMAAPGVDVLSTWYDGGMMLQSGTSMAAPHVAGTIALLWSSNPNLIGDIAATERLLTETSEPAYSTECGDQPRARPNNVYGWGRLDAWRAVRAARVDVPWLEAPTAASFPAGAPATIQVTLDARQVPGPGRYTARLVVQRPGGQDSYPVVFDVTPSASTSQIQGRLVDRWSGNGVYGRLQFGGGPLIQTTLSGAYSATLPYGAYPLTASAAGYLPLLTALAVPQQQTRVLTITPDIPHLALSAPPLSATLRPGERREILIGLANQGSQELKVRAGVPRLDWSVEDSLAGGPTGPLYDLSALPALPLGDDQVYTDALDLGFSIPAGDGFVSAWYVSSNGWVSASEPRGAVPGAGCLPTFNLPDDSFAGFWADLDPSRGGSIRAGQVNADTFVVSYERVPMFSSQPRRPEEPTFTFQIIARSSGEVLFRYGQMGALPQRWGVGAVPAEGGGQSIACHSLSQTLPARTWTLLKQPPAPIWLDIDPERELEIPPGGQAVITATLRGAGYVPWRMGPLRGRIELETNDPRQLSAALDARLTLLAPAFQAWIPALRR